MPDISHEFGGDLELGTTGDLEVVDTPALTQQRVLRRLLTNAGDYIWHLDYGAGLAQFVGQTTNVMQIKAIIRSQIFAEAAVANAPEPLIDVSAAAGGLVSVQLRYTDATTSQTQVLSFSLDS